MGIFRFEGCRFANDLVYETRYRNKIAGKFIAVYIAVLVAAEAEINSGRPVFAADVDHR